MTIEELLKTRSQSACELCNDPENLAVFAVGPNSDGSAAQSIYLCRNCSEQINDPETMDVHHWRCLNDSMWSQEPAIQVMAWRILTRLCSESWAQDLMAMLYLEESTLAWARAGLDENNPDSDTNKHLDANGALLAAGDTVTLIKDLNVKGAGFTAKRGTAVRNITLVHDNSEHIEGRVSGQQIVILTKFVKKS
ncbi:MAG: PhnA protein [Hyphomicrobiales bacterium]|nr:MAG: PhnA protein [Hyphomicrobiales bacterium]